MDANQKTYMDGEPGVTMGLVVDSMVRWPKWLRRCRHCGELFLFPCDLWDHLRWVRYQKRRGKR